MEVVVSSCNIVVVLVVAVVRIVVVVIVAVEKSHEVHTFHHFAIFAIAATEPAAVGNCISQKMRYTLTICDFGCMA
jgi:hypothetical protein